MKSLYLIFWSFLLINMQIAQGTLCKSYEVPKDYLAMKKSVRSEVDKLASNKVIAEYADITLSKLITSKSPLITLWYQRGNFKDKSELEVAQSWRVYYVQNFILMKYPQDEKINTEVEKVVDEQLSKYFTKEYKGKLESLFNVSRDQAIQTITEMNLTQGKEIVERIKKIQLYWPVNLKTAKNNSIPLDVIDWGVAYDPNANEINIGLDSIIYSSDENYLAVFAHEIGHSFDPCRWGAYFTGPWPFSKVGECLRSDSSVSAKKRDDSKLEEFGRNGKLSSELVVALKANPTCNKLVYPPTGLQADQLPETFADWFSAEVVARVKNLDVKKLRLDLCADKKLSVGSSYISNQDRQEKIYLSHPKIKALLTSDEAQFKLAQYCGM